MVKSALSLSKNLIISRIQQKDLAQIKLHQRGLLSARNLTRLTLDPFFDSLPVNVGLILSLVGGKIFDVEVRRHYFCHDLEETLAHQDFAQGLKALERLEKNVPLFYQLAYQVAFEELVDLVCDPKVARLRSMAIEVARSYHHLVTLEKIFDGLRLNDLAELAHYIVALLEGSIKPWLRISKATNDVINIITYKEFDGLLEEVNLDFRDLEIQARENKSLKEIMLGKGFVSLATASAYGLTGAFLHANGIAYEPYRKLTPRIAYPKTFAPWLEDGGDIYARFLVRLMECRASLGWLQETLRLNHRDGIELQPLTFQEPLRPAAPSKIYARGEIAGPEGDVVASLFFSQKNSLLFSLRTPAYFTAQIIPHLLYNLDLSDIPMVLLSLGITAEEIDK